VDAASPALVCGSRDAKLRSTMGGIVATKSPHLNEKNL
jgi:hypothetical protein